MRKEVGWAKATALKIKNTRVKYFVFMAKIIRWFNGRKIAFVRKIQVTSPPPSLRSPEFLFQKGKLFKNQRCKVNQPKETDFFSSNLMVLL
jgi:hypothetical protein